MDLEHLDEAEEGFLRLLVGMAEDHPGELLTFAKGQEELRLPDDAKLRQLAILLKQNGLVAGMTRSGAIPSGAIVYAVRELDARRRAAAGVPPDYLAQFRKWLHAHRLAVVLIVVGFLLTWLVGLIGGILGIIAFLRGST